MEIEDAIEDQILSTPATRKTQMSIHQILNNEDSEEEDEDEEEKNEEEDEEEENEEEDEVSMEEIMQIDTESGEILCFFLILF